MAPERNLHAEGTLTTRHDGVAIGTHDIAPLPAPPAGAQIGRYVVEDLLGSGGMGVVVVARDPELERQVALKVVRRDVGDRSHRLRLVREARAMARLEHENVVRVYDAGEHDGEVFIAMELVRGRTVGQWMRAAAQPWSEVLARFIAAGRGLAAAHDAGMVHRDFKPDNVLIRDADDRVCVTDFGLAVAFLGDAPAGSAPGADGETGAAGSSRPERSALTRTGTVAGTPAYMAPEQCGGGEVDARADVYSFCVSLYEGLYGRRPFGAYPTRDRGAWTAKDIAREARPPSRQRIPRALHRALLRGLATDPADRWQDMHTLLAALARVRGRPRRRWIGAAALVALAALVATGVALVVVAPWRARVPAPPAGYRDGLRLLQRDDFPGAAAAFERATRERPDFAPAWLGLASARQHEPDLPRARAAIAHGVRLVAADDRPLRLQAEGLEAELDEKWDTAIDRYQAYFRFFPGDVEVGLALIDAQGRGGHAKDALATITALRAVSNDARLALAESKAAQMIVDWEHAKAAGDRAVELARAQDAPAILARALLRRGVALGALARREAALADLAAADALAEKLGDRFLRARELGARAQVLAATGDLEGSAQASEQAAVLDRTIGEPHVLVSDLINVANVRVRMGHLERARAMYEEVFVVLRPLDDRTQLTNVLLSYGELLSDLGARAEADKALRESIDVARAAGYDVLVANALGDLAWNNFGLGLVEQAEAEWRESIVTAERHGDTTTVVSGYKGLALVKSAQGDLAGAVRTQEKAVQLAERGDPTRLATEQTWYAVHLLGIGQYARAADTAVAAAAVLRDHHVERDELIAHAAAAFALARLDRRAAASAQLALGRALLAHSLLVDYRAHAAAWLVRAAVQLGARDDARAILAAAPHDHVALPWAKALAVQAGQLGVRAP